MKTFRLVRTEDVTGVSGTGIVAEGVEFTSGVVALTWMSDWPTSVVFHEKGIESVLAIHGHNGATRIEYLPDGERYEEEARWLRPWAAMVSDLDRSAHGRHEGDVQSGSPTGRSEGNPHLPVGTVLGYSLDGTWTYIVPPRENRYDPDAWKVLTSSLAEAPR